MTTQTFDIVIVGAGTAGAAAAYHLARTGWSVALLDARDFAASGASWVNGVADWMYDRAEIPRAQEPELRGPAFPASLLDAHGRNRVRVPSAPLRHTDMRLLVQRLQRMAGEAGVTSLPYTRVHHFHFEGERPVALDVERHLPDSPPQPMTLAARLFVDASGLGGVLRRQVRCLYRDCPEVPGVHICDAAQQVRRVTDPEQARAYMASYSAQPHEVLSFLGVEGGFSTLNVSFEEQPCEVEFLAGSTADGRHLSGEQLIEGFIADKPWVGELVFGGSGRIPMRRPYDRQGVPGLVLIGNAGSQVFPAHASGIGFGMIAAKILSESLHGERDPGSLHAVWRYQAGFQRELGAVCGAYDVFRRLSQHLSSDDLHFLFESGLMTVKNAWAGMNQSMPEIDFADAVAMASRGLGRPDLLLRFGAAAARMQVVHRWYQRYPAYPDERALRRWSRIVALLFGETPDILYGPTVLR